MIRNIRSTIAAGAILCALLAEAASAGARGPVTGLPLPRFVSMKAPEGNVRRGPALSHRIDWVFKHAGTPLKITAEHGHWRRVEDRSGEGGWMHYSLLSGSRMGLVTGAKTAFRLKPTEGAAAAAFAEEGAILRMTRCEAQWCQVMAQGQKGWVQKTSIWGVFPSETFE